MKINNLSDADKFYLGQKIEIANSRRTDSIKVIWIGYLHEDEACGIKAKYYAFKRGSKLGIAYVDNEQLTIMDTEIFADEMGIPKEKIRITAETFGRLRYDHLFLG